MEPAFALDRNLKFNVNDDRELDLDTINEAKLPWLDNEIASALIWRSSLAQPALTLKTFCDDVDANKSLLLSSANKKRTFKDHH